MLFLALLVHSGTFLCAIQADDRRPSELLQKLENAGEDALAEIVDRALKNEKDWHKAELQACLSELIRRKGDRWKTLLRRVIKETTQLDSAAKSSGDVEILTALRRLEEKPDPLQIEAAPIGIATNWYPNLPVLRVALKNVDAGGATVTIVAGGDYRSGRMDRWRLQVTDATGRPMPIRSEFGDGTGGGLYGHKELKPGDRWTASLPMRDFVETLPAGEYGVVVQYSDSDTIAGEKDVRGRVLCVSSPFKFKVERRVIELTREERDRFAAQVENLPDKGPVKILQGTYGRSAHGFIPPDSPAGVLLGGGWKAFPALKEALSRPLPAARKAWVFAIIANVAHEGFPLLNSDAFGSYEMRLSSWAVEMEEAAGFGLGGKASGNGAIREEAQAAKAAWWTEWAKSVDVRLNE